MSTNSTTKRTEKKRSEPWSTTHRKMIDMFLNPTAEEMLIQQAVKEHKRACQAEEEAHDFFMEMFVFGIINPANERLDEDDKTHSFIDHSEDAKYKIKVERQNKRGFKDFVIEAKALFQEVLDETIDEENSTVPVGIIKMIKSMLFGRTERSSFKFTSALQEFMQMDPEELGDQRLVKAQEIVINAFKVEKSRWYRRVWRYDDGEKRYVPIRPQYQVPEPEETE